MKFEIEKIEIKAKPRKLNCTFTMLPDRIYTIPPETPLRRFLRISRFYFGLYEPEIKG